MHHKLGAEGQARVGGTEFQVAHDQVTGRYPASVKRVRHRRNGDLDRLELPDVGRSVGQYSRWW